jgi:hypothetical protein
MSRRSYGTGSLYVRRDSAGRETWYGQWRAGAKLVKRAHRAATRGRDEQRSHQGPGRARTPPEDRQRARLGVP